jgi:hypothetical protein
MNLESHKNSYLMKIFFFVYYYSEKTSGLLTGVIILEQYLHVVKTPFITFYLGHGCLGRSSRMHLLEARKQSVLASLTSSALLKCDHT